MKRGALKKADSTLVNVYFQNPFLDQVNVAVVELDTDRSKFVRQAVREKLHRLLCRTGSMQHNIWLATRAKRQGKKWNPYEGILSGGQWRVGLGAENEQYVPFDEKAPLTLQQFNTEADLYSALELPFIKPQNREYDYLVKHFGP